MSDAVLNQFTQAVEEEKVSTGRRFKVGIIGTGWIAEHWIGVIPFCCRYALQREK